jgi:hypothetical protein
MGVRFWEGREEEETFRLCFLELGLRVTSFLSLRARTALATYLAAAVAPSFPEFSKKHKHSKSELSKKRQCSEAEPSPHAARGWVGPL